VRYVIHGFAGRASSFRERWRNCLNQSRLRIFRCRDITDAATVNRATFYDTLQTDKFALLEALIAGGFHQMLEERSVRYDGTCPSAGRGRYPGCLRFTWPGSGLRRAAV